MPPKNLNCTYQTTHIRVIAELIVITKQLDLENQLLAEYGICADRPLFKIGSKVKTFTRDNLITALENDR